MHSRTSSAIDAKIESTGPGSAVSDAGGPTDPRSLPIVMFENIHPQAVDELHQRGHEVRVVARAIDSRKDDAVVSDTRIIGIRSKSVIDEALLERAPNLIAIGCFCIGTNQVDLNAARARGVAVFNAPFSNTRSVAELTIAEIIALHRKLGDKSAALHRGEWDKSAVRAHEVRGRVLGIIGYGHIGSQVSILAEALGMRVIYFDIASKLPIGNATPVNSIEELLDLSDVVSLHVPATPRTERMIDAAAFERMKPGAFFINNARGSIFDDEALRDAIESGHIAGAGIDVYPQEPQKNPDAFSTPLAGLQNVILTPHIGGSTEEAQIGIAQDVTTKLLRFIEDGSTSTAVNVPAVDLPQLRPHQHRILHFHRNVPGVLSKMHGVLAELEININAEYLQSDAEISYVILDVDHTHGQEVMDGLRAIPETIRVRTLW